MATRLASVLPLVACALLCGCRPNGASKGESNDAICVSVAASTAEVMERLAAKFAREHNVAIKVNPGPSSGLASQILEGAPVDLFLSASREFADAVAEAKLTERSCELLTNRLVIIAPRHHLATIQKPEDLLSDSVKKIALAGENVPAGKYAEQALGKLGLFDKLQAAGKIARAQDVRGALRFIEEGEAEAGVVYATDAIGANVVVVYEFDVAHHDEIVYVLTLLRPRVPSTQVGPSAEAFYQFLQSSDAAADFERAGFQRFRAQNLPAR